MAQELMNILNVAANQAGWDAPVRANFQALQGKIRTLKMTIAVQGGIASPSTLNIQIQDSNGNNLAETFQLRVRICNNAGWTNATNATIAAGSGTTLLETLTASKDLVLQSNSSGLLVVTLTDATIETVTLRPGAAPFSPSFCDSNNSLNCAHA